MFWKISLRLILLFQFFGALKSLDTCDTCVYSQFDYGGKLLCRCDDHCQVYGDCCPNYIPIFLPPVIDKSLRSAAPYMECQNRYKEKPTIVVGDAYYMVSSCPLDWVERIIDVQFAEHIAENCASSKPEFDDFAPVTDYLTGITYKNEFCATCHNVDNLALLIWSTRLTCNGTFRDLLSTRNITFDELRFYCSRCSFDPRAIPLIILRWCIPLTRNCSESENDDKTLVDNCINGTYDPISQLIPIEKVYKNVDCAKCNGVSEIALGCKYLNVSTDETMSESRCVTSTMKSKTMMGHLPISVVLDVQRSGVVSLTSKITEEIEVINCKEYQIFDPVLGCRNITCPEGFTVISGFCLPTLKPPSIVPFNETSQDENTTDTDSIGSGNITPIDDVVGDNMTINDNSNVTNGTIDSIKNCTTIALDPKEYITINDSFVLFREEVVDILGYDENERPVVCVNFNRSGNISKNETVTFLHYPVGFTELTYAGSCLSMLASLSILVTYSIFKELRTLASKLLMNLAIAFLLSDVLLIFSGIISQKIQSIGLCSAISILLHCLLLARFSLMNCVGIEYTRRFVQATRLQAAAVTMRSQTILLLGYCIVGWGLPLLITIVTVIINYALDGVVMYGMDGKGEQGLCWINDTISAIVAFLVPITIVNISFFVAIAVLIFKAGCTTRSKEIEQHRSLQMRIVLGIFSVLGLAWVLAFFALLSGQFWAWYPFIIINSNQAVFIAIGFLATKKIAYLYISLFKFKSSAVKNVNSSPSKHKSTRVIEMESMESLDNQADDQ